MSNSTETIHHVTPVTPPEEPRPSSQQTPGGQNDQTITVQHDTYTSPPDNPTLGTNSSHNSSNTQVVSEIAGTSGQFNPELIQAIQQMYPFYFALQSNNMQPSLHNPIQQTETTTTTGKRKRVQEVEQRTCKRCYLPMRGYHTIDSNKKKHCVDGAFVTEGTISQNAVEQALQAKSNGEWGRRAALQEFIKINNQKTVEDMNNFVLKEALKARPIEIDPDSDHE